MFDVMYLIRLAARSLFASAFIADGIRKATKPEESASRAEKVTNRVASFTQRVVPASYSSHVPERPEAWVRLCGVAQVVGGAMFATGIGRRLGALLLVGTGAMNVATSCSGKETDLETKQAQRSEALTKMSLLGGAILALQPRPRRVVRAPKAAS